MTEEEKEAIERAKRELQKTTFLTDIAHKDLKTILNLIQKLQKEAEQYKQLYERALSDLVLADKKVVEKDKIIDLMSRYIDINDFDINCSSLCVHEDCQEECIKQYFEKQAKEV